MPCFYNTHHLLINRFWRRFGSELPIPGLDDDETLHCLFCYQEEYDGQPEPRDGISAKKPGFRRCKKHVAKQIEKMTPAQPAKKMTAALLG